MSTKNMTKKTQTIALYFSIIIMAIASIFWVNGLILAWTAPASTPPDGNVNAPLNVGSTGQSKAGGLILNTGGAATGLIVDQGNVGIGTAAPGAKLEVDGNIIADAPINDDHLATKAYVDAAGGGGGACDGDLLKIKFTSTKYNGDLGGIAGADAKCSAEFPGYTFCTKDVLEYAGRNGCIVDASQYTDNLGWYRSQYNNCLNYTTNKFAPPYHRGSRFSSSGGVWGIYDANQYCDTVNELICCK